MTVCHNIETACGSLGNIKIPNRDGFRAGTTQYVFFKDMWWYGWTLTERALDSDGNAMNMNRNNDGQFNVSNDNRDNRNPDNGLRQKFLGKSPSI